MKASAPHIDIPLPRVGEPIRIGRGHPLTVIAGPCVIESREHVLRHAEQIREMASASGLQLIFKSSFDKANRTAASSFRGVGIAEGLKILEEVRTKLNIPVITDVHSPSDAEEAGVVVDILQIPAFLCRQTDLLIAAGKSGKPVMVKKGQFVAPEDMRFAVEKIRGVGNNKVLLCERGVCFGYRELVVDFRSLELMAGIGCPVVFDATHSVQIMGGGNGVSSGNREFVPLLARAAVAAGVAAVFVECHENPDGAPSDGPNMLPLKALPRLLRDLHALSSMTLETRDT